MHRHYSTASWIDDISCRQFVHDTADLPIIQQILNKTSLLGVAQLRPVVAFVLTYELLFGQVYATVS